MNIRKTHSKKYKIEDYINKKIGHATVIGIDESSKNYRWLCRCTCGKIFQVIPSKLIRGCIRSCGCQKNNGSRHSNDEFYNTWYLMMSRCYKKNNCSYKTHGERGISVCEEWKNPETFINWCHSTIGHKKKEYTIDRIDVNGNYCPENCRWATSKEQQRNKRNTRFETINGETRPLSEWCEIYKIPPHIVRERINKLGWEIERALSQPIGVSPCGQRGGKFIEIDGKRNNISEWAKIYGVSSNAIYKRILSGWDAEKAIKTPSNRKKSNL